MPAFILKVIVVAESSADAQEAINSIFESHGEFNMLLLDDEPKEIQT